MLLLRYCHIPRINHLARSVLPDHIRPAADLHDFQSRSTFTSLMGCGSVDDSVWLQATLPIKLGGFGLSSVSTISQSAFLASWAHSLHELPARFPDSTTNCINFAAYGFTEPHPQLHLDRISNAMWDFRQANKASAQISDRNH